MTAEKKKPGIITRVQFRKNKSTKDPAVKLPSSRRLIKETVQLMFRYRGTFAGLGLVYLLGLWLLVALPTQAAYQDAKDLLGLTIEGGAEGVVGIGTLVMGGFSGLFTGVETREQQLLGSIITMLFILCIIFAARHLIARKNDDEDPEVSLRDVLYNAPSPFISFTFVIFIALIAIIPGALGAFLIPYVISLQEPWVAEAVFSLIGLALIVVSVFWLIRLLFAFFIVTLPGTRPWEAVRETKELVSGRRWNILWRLLVLALVLVVTWGVLFLPFLFIDLGVDLAWFPLVPAVIDIINATLIMGGLTYIYKLYRSLL